MDLDYILKLIYDNYINENLVFNTKDFKKNHIEEYNFLIEKFNNINNVILYMSLNKNNNKFINSINDLKNYLLFNYLEENKLNGRTYMDLIENTDFNVNQVRYLHSFLKDYYNIKDLVE